MSKIMEATQTIIIRLPSVMCFIAEFPLSSSSNRTFCTSSSSASSSANSSSGDVDVIHQDDSHHHNSLCYTCPLASSYLSRDVSQGRQTCYALWILILVIGSFGVVTNCLNIIILLGKAPSCGPSLTSLLIPLSMFDIIASGFAVGYSTLSLLILENMSRSWLTMKLYQISLVTYLLGRTGSLFIAILITVERYLVVAHPFKMKIYMSVGKTRAAAVVTSLIAVLSNVPRYISVCLAENENAAGSIPPLRDFPYLFRSTWTGLLIFKEMVWVGRLHFLLDFLLPLPVLLLLNLLLFRKIRQVNLKRRLLSPHQRNEVASAKMFGVVVTILLISHILPITFYVYLTFFKLIYRELSFGTTLSVSVNAALHFFVYFAYGRLFRKRFVELLSCAFHKVLQVVVALCCNCSSNNSNCPTTTTTKTTQQQKNVCGTTTVITQGDNYNDDDDSNGAIWYL